MAVPFSALDSWEMNATCFQGSIFLEENHSNKLSSKEAQHLQPARPGAPSQDIMSYWGYKFETLSLLPQPWYSTTREYIKSREDQVVSNYAQYCSVARTGYGKTKMIIGGEVDAGENFALNSVLMLTDHTVWDIKPEDKSSPINWVELKTSAEINSERDQIKFERKLMKFWIQSFLLGVPKIIVGFRTTDGILVRLEELDTQSIPEMVKSRGRNLWDGNTCINFAANFLECMHTVLCDVRLLIKRQGSRLSSQRMASGEYEREKRPRSLKCTSLKKLVTVIFYPQISCDGGLLNFRASSQRKLQRPSTYQRPLTATPTTQPKDDEHLHIG